MIRQKAEDGTNDYRILGVQVKQPPGFVHEIRKVVEDPKTHAEDIRAAVFQRVVLGGDGLGKAKLEISRATWR